MEQEKREQERQASTLTIAGNDQPTNSGLLSDQDFERLRADVLSSTTQAIPNQNIIPMHQQQQQLPPPPSTAGVMQLNHQSGIRQQFLPRPTNQQQQWKTNMSLPLQMPGNINQSNIISNTSTTSGANIEPNTIRKEG